MVLGYTQVSWDNESGLEPKPASDDKDWNELTDNERAAAVVLGYTEMSWDTGAPQPASDDKDWSQLTVCGEDLIMLYATAVIILIREIIEIKLAN